jgi:TniQ
MNRIGQRAVAVKILDPSSALHPDWSSLQMSHVPARSKLYGPVPREVGTVWVESLTSYLHRLAVKYGVEPRRFVTEAIFPHLVFWHETRPSFATHLGSFYRREALGMNGTGELAQSLSQILCQLTRRSDVGDTTLSLWANQLPTRFLLRWSPAWCPACYTTWQESGQVLYHPLLWMLQVVTVCPRHRCALVDRCPHCQQRQSVIAASTQPGYCTQCTRWLGVRSSYSKKQEITDAMFNWQAWVVRCIEELYLGSRAFGTLPWTDLPQGLLTCREALGDGRSLARLTNLPYSMLWPWSHGKQTPSFKRLLEFGYVLDVTPLELLVSTAEGLKERIATRESARRAHPRPSARCPIDWERIGQYLQDILAGRESAPGVCYVARQVGISARYLRRKFPEECASITAQYQKNRASQAEQRMAQQSLEVRQATIALHAQGIKPTKQRVQALLSDAHILRRPEGRATWHVVRRELGLEQ